MKFIFYIFLFASLNLLSQTFNYSYLDPCTGVLKTILVPKEGVTVNYFNQMKTFQPDEMVNGTFSSWASSVLQSYGGGNPCGSIIGVSSAIDIGQQTAINTINLINSISSIADYQNSIAESIDGGAGSLNITSSLDGAKSTESKKDKKQENKSNDSKTSESQISNSQNGQTSSNSEQNNNTNQDINSQNTTSSQQNNQNTQNNTNNSNGGQSSQNQGNNQENGQNSSIFGGNTDNLNQNSNISQNDQSPQSNNQTELTPNGSNSTQNGDNNTQTGINSQSQNNGTNTNNNNQVSQGNSQTNSGDNQQGGTSNTNSSTNTSSNEQGGNVGSSNQSTQDGSTSSEQNINGGQGNGQTSNQSNQSEKDTPKTETNTETTENNKNSNVMGGAVTSIQRASGSKEGGKPSILLSSDLTGFNFKQGDVSYGGKGTMGYTSMRWDGLRTHGIMADYTTIQNGPNITAFYAIISKKRIDLISTTMTASFLGKGSLYGTLALGQMWIIKKNLKAIYLLTGSFGKVYTENFKGTAVVTGGMYDLKMGKRIDMKMMGLFIYAPFISYYNDIVLKSPYVIMPVLGTNIKITKNFKFNINFGGAYAINENVMNFTIMCGTRLAL